MKKLIMRCAMANPIRGSQIHDKPCGSEPAREEGLTVDIDVVCAAVFASRLAPTGLAFYCSAVLSGNRTRFFALNEPKYNQSPYSRAVVIGE
ncbi:hypothetical protein D3C76_886380 [compost metagenome]|nr:hypothetical protein SAMN04490206_2852 [Pseudomonas umsongensis]